MNLLDLFPRLTPIFGLVQLVVTTWAALKGWLIRKRCLISYWRTCKPYTSWRVRHPRVPLAVPEGLGSKNGWWLSSLAITNPGSEPLKIDDYDPLIPPSITAGGAPILFYRVARTNVRGLAQAIKGQAPMRGPEFPKLLLNQGDAFELWVVTSGRPTRLKVDGHLVGTRVAEVRESVDDAYPNYFAAMLLLGVGMVVMKRVEIWSPMASSIWLMVIGATALTASAWFLVSWIHSAVPWFWVAMGVSRVKWKGNHL